MWLDAHVRIATAKPYLDCAPEQQKEILDLIAYRKNAEKDPGLSQGVEFFAFLREMTADGFFTSEIGIKYLGYVGNTYLLSFNGLPSGARSVNVILSAVTASRSEAVAKSKDPYSYIEACLVRASSALAEKFTGATLVVEVLRLRPSIR